MLIASFFVTRIPHRGTNSFYSLELFCTFKTSDEKSNFILKVFIRNVGLYKILKENQKKINFLKLFKLLCLALITFCNLCTNLYPKMKLLGCNLDHKGFKLIQLLRNFCDYYTWSSLLSVTSNNSFVFHSKLSPFWLILFHLAGMVSYSFWWPLATLNNLRDQPHIDCYYLSLCSYLY